jgi:hypothetical protein
VNSQLGPRVTWEVTVSLDFSKEDWFKERFRDRAERQEGFAHWRVDHPLQARVWLGYCGYADSAFEAMFTARDVEAFKRSASAMSELASWVSDDRLQAVGNIDEIFQEYLRAGLPVQHAIDLAQKPGKKKRGRPVSNRWPIMLALEHWMQIKDTQDHDLSWMQLAIRFCRCGKQHNERCRNRLRQQVMVLERKLLDLGV